MTNDIEEIWDLVQRYGILKVLGVHINNKGDRSIPCKSDVETLARDFLIMIEIKAQDIVRNRAIEAVAPIRGVSYQGKTDPPSSNS